jgi:hypothetical protein
VHLDTALPSGKKFNLAADIPGEVLRRSETPTRIEEGEAMRTSRFTLVDCTAVAGIVALCGVLLLPGTLRARTVSRQKSCLNNFKHIGLALHNYHATHGVLPPGRVWEPNPMRSAHDCGVLMMISPYVEQSAVYNSYNFHTGGWASVQNKTSRVQRIEVFLCPDDKLDTVSAKVDPVGSPSNVAFSLGSKAFLTHPSHASANLGPAPEGLFFDNSRVGFRDVLDGTAFTVAAAEQLIDHARSGGPSEFTGDCSGLQTDGTHYSDRSGSRWISGHPASNYFNARRPPNDTQPDCYSGVYPVGLGALNKVPRSRHVGGVNILIGDGSARFVRAAIDLTVWQALNTRSGSERVESSQF